MGKHFSAKFLTVFLLMTLLATACGAQPKATTPLAKSDAQYTEAYETIVAGLTAGAPTATEVPPTLPPPTATEPPTQVVQVMAPTATLEPLPATSTPLPTRTPLPSDTPLPTNTPLPTLTFTPEPTLTATPLPGPNWVLALTENFSFTAFWPTGEQDDSHMHFTRGGYAIKNKTIQDIVWAVRTDTYGSVRVEVDANRIDGPMDGYYGIVCHFGDGSNYYFLGVGSDGWFGIARQQRGDLTFLKEGRGSTAVLTGNAVNHLRADCYQGTLTLYVNDVLLLQVEDLTFTGGSVGLGVGTRKTSLYEALFDNLMIYVIGP